MSDAVTDPPLRQLMRLQAEMMMSSAERTRKFLPGTPMLGVEYGIVARVCLPAWTPQGVLGPPVDAMLAIPARQIARSLEIAPETVRRHIKLLIDWGLVSQSSEGVSLSHSPDHMLQALHYYRGVHDLMLRLVEDVHRTCDVEIEVAEVPVFTQRDVIARGLDILLRRIDAYRSPTISGQAYLLWGALTAVAVRQITFDPVLSRRYRNSVPPDDLRQSISLRRLAAAMSIPYATAWRHMRDLLAAGMVTRLSDDRWTVLRENLLRETVRDTGEPSTLSALRMVRELGLLGLDPADVSAHYFDGRPPLADLG